jgi:hypothetical protein
LVILIFGRGGTESTMETTIDTSSVINVSFTPTVSLMDRKTQMVLLSTLLRRDWTVKSLGLQRITTPGKK